MQDGIPDWASHIAFVEPSTDPSSSSWVVRTGKAGEMKDRIARYQEGVSAPSSVAILRPPVKGTGEALVELKDVNVSYHERRVSAAPQFEPTTKQKPFRCCKTRIGPFVQTKDGTSRDQTVRLWRFHTCL